jgi:gamma-glutamyltranspeptidase/glutathione hydrolase
MTGFTTESGHPNVVAPKKRPAHTLCPVMVLADGQLRYLLGSPGGLGQTVTVAQVLTNLVDRCMTIKASISAPRWSLDPSGNIILEAALSPDLVMQLKKSGIETKHTPDGSRYFGSAQVVECRAGGCLAGWADIRRDDLALGI